MLLNVAAPTPEATMHFKSGDKVCVLGDVGPSAWQSDAGTPTTPVGCGGLAGGISCRPASYLYPPGASEPA